MYTLRVFFVAFLGILVNSTIAITDEQTAEIQSKFVEVSKECLNDNPLTADDIIAFKDKKFPDGENAGCFAACVFKNLGIMDEQGQLSHAGALEEAKKVFSDEEELKNIEDFLSTCSKVNLDDVTDGEKGCDRAKLVFNCLIENSEKHGFNLDFN
ncbi:general odorant-binding protein 19d-like [Hyposmocoma kahamanoa]|uniref:general odorant-binding protein 19d-like n=1 Tax=Hyposmocoma kahamanoa TaxID=1477025 RepID=UPI000E6D992F|nr:general odorant-binding protein 19d-like [Hyposmocoma kahamanoa]